MAAAAVAILPRILMWSGVGTMAVLVLQNNEHLMKEITNSFQSSNSRNQIIDMKTLEPLSNQVLLLSKEVAKLRYDRFHPHASSSSSSSILGIGNIMIISCIASGCYIYYNGIGNFMYVTKKTFQTSMETLKTNMNTITDVLETTKYELELKLGLVDQKLDTTRISLEDKITTEVGSIKNELLLLQDSITDMNTSQLQLQNMVQGLENQMMQANRGIYLLCNVVADNMIIDHQSQLPTQNNDKKSRLTNLYEELMNYTTNTVFGYSNNSYHQISNENYNNKKQNDGLKELSTITTTTTTIEPIRNTNHIMRRFIS